MKDFIVPVNPRDLIQSSKNSPPDEYRVSDEILLTLDDTNPEELITATTRLLQPASFSIYENFDQLFQLIIHDSSRHVLRAWTLIYQSFKKSLPAHASNFQLTEFKMYTYLLSELTKLAKAQ